MQKDQMIRIAEASLPRQAIKKVQFISSGWDNDLLIINKRIAFRFPKKEGMLDQFTDELTILQRLAMKDPVLQIPRYQPVYEGSRIKGVSYPLLKGESLSQCLNNFQASHENARLIADFLTKLHSIQLSEFQGTHLHTESREALFSRVQTFYGLQPVFHELLHEVQNNEPINRELLQRFLELSALVFH
ncbi:phosphotransferase [Sporolactobacillus vineae]|uniref:phosphotransferase n=1 Tax=Sporolactobacillus vineae TaxID=444463 RepID=UPI0002882A53|nr:phosphotransferase [Sporolactobacillus vineae]